MRVLRTSKGTHFGNVMRCGAIWVCPVCAAKVSELRRDELQTAITEWCKGGGSVYLVTLTFQHKLHDDLAVMLDTFLGAFRAMTGHRSYRALRADYGLVHSVRALEVTVSTRNGWHPHLHMLYFSEQAPADSREGAAELERLLTVALYARWSVELDRVGLSASSAYGVKVQATAGAVADYVAKFGREPKRANPWGTESELTKAHTKRSRSESGATPFDLVRGYAASGSVRCAAWFQEYARVFKGRRQLLWSRGLRAAVGLGVELTDEEAAEVEQEVAELVCELDGNQWAAVLAARARARVLAIARVASGDEVLAFVDSLRGDSQPAGWYVPAGYGLPGAFVPI
jgi:hypothetical protein